MLKNLPRYLSIPYQWNGRDWRGCDCWGLVILFMETEFNVHIYDYKHGYSEDKGLTGSTYMIDRAHEDYNAASSPNIGDIVIMRHGSRTPNHCGVLINSNEFLHIYKGVTCHVSRLKDWHDRLCGIYRHKELTNENKIYSKSIRQA